MKTERVANLLNDWLSNSRYQQTALARKSGLSQLSFLRNGLRGMTRDALEGLLPALREEDRPILLKQWILDVLPDSYRDRVTFKIDEGKAKSNEPVSGFTSLEDAFSILRLHAPKNRELTRVLVNLATLLLESRRRK